MKFLFLLSALLAVTSAYWYDGQHDEMVYSYLADVRTLLHDPGLHSSAFHMRGDLHVRKDKDGNGTVFWFKNVEVSAHNGENEDFSHHDVWTKLPKESEAIYKPFYVGYEKSALVTDIMFQKDEPEWTHNFKKAIASSLQMDVPKLEKAFALDHPYTFYTEENTIYGKCRVAYETKPEDKDNYFVTKYIDPKHCDGHFEQVYTNIVPTQCHEDHDDSYRTPTMKVFSIDKTKKQVKNMHSSGKILMYPFKVQDNLQIIWINQDFAFKEYVKAEEKIELSSFVVYYPITFTKPHVGDHMYTPDYTFGRQQIDVETIVPKIKEMFYEAVEYLNENPIDNTVPDTKQGLVINRILKFLKYFDITHFEKVWQSLKDGKEDKDVVALEMFYKMLPNVGTYPSVMFIKNLIAEHKVKDYVSTAMLYTMGVNIHVPSEKLLQDLEVFINWQDKVKPDVYYAAILSYATIIYETYKYHENDENVEKYIKIYYKHLIEAKEYEEQLIWMQGLTNIRIGSVYELMKPIVTGEPVFKYDRHLRAHAIWNIYHPLVDHKVDAFELFWPVVVNRDLHIELRVAALKSVMRTADMSELYFIFQYMQHVECPHLYHYFYTGVKSLAHSEIYCDRRSNITAFAEQVEQYYNNAPVEVGTQVWLRDYIDEEYDIGFTIYGNTIANEKTNEINQIYMKFDSYMSNHFYNNLAIHIKFEGIEFPVETFLSDLINFSADTFKGHLFKRTEEPLHIEITLTHHEQVVFSKYFNEASVKGFFSADFFKLISLLKYQFTNVQYTLQGEVNVPTDIGFTAQFYTYMPMVTHFKSEIPLFKEDTKEVVIKTKKVFRIWKHGAYGVNIYNPIAAMTQGVRRVYAFDANFPVNYLFAVNYDNDKFTIKIDKQEEDTYRVFGVRTHVSSQVISVPDKGVDIMHETCNECDQYVTVTKGKSFKLDKDIYEGTSNIFGLDYYYGMFDCEYSSHDMLHHSSEHTPFSHDFLYEFGKVPLKKFLVHTYQWFMKSAYIYPKGSCGMVLYSKPAVEHSVESLEIKVELHREHYDDETIEHPEFHHIIVPHHKNKIGMTFTTKDNEDKMVTKWEGEMEFEHADGHLFTNVDMHWSSKSNEHDTITNICFQREREYTHDSISDNYGFYYGDSHKRECVRDDFYISVNVGASHSDEQKTYHAEYDKDYTYTDCQPLVPWAISSDVSYNCLYAQSSLRHYNYNIHFDRVPKDFEYYFKHFWHYMKQTFHAEYKHESEDFVYTKDMIVDIIYPISYKEPIAEVTVSHDDQSYVFHDFPVSKYWWFAQPESLDIPLYTRFARYLNEYTVCNIVPFEHYHALPHHTVAEVPTHEWQMYASNDEKNYTWAIFVQKPEKDEHHLSLKFIINDHWIVLKPQTETDIKHFGETQYSAVFDPKLLKYFANNYADPEMHGLRMITVKDTIFFSVPDYGMLFAYDGKYARVMTVDVDHDKYKFHGKCYH